MATALFLATSIAFSSLIRSKTIIRSFSTNSVDLEYTRILSNMFKAVKAPSRHVNNDNSVNQIFNERVNFFKDVMKNSNIDEQKVKFIHVAGTKGKGSTCEYISAGLRAAGYKVGVFTSPHLHTARERIKIGKSLITRQVLFFTFIFLINFD